jgi:hypothetical protein
MPVCIPYCRIHSQVGQLLNSERMIGVNLKSLRQPFTGRSAGAYIEDHIRILVEWMRGFLMYLKEKVIL